MHYLNILSLYIELINYRFGHRPLILNLIALQSGLWRTLQSQLNNRIKSCNDFIEGWENEAHGRSQNLYDSSNRLFGKIEESLWEGPQQKDDHDKKDPENRSGQLEMER